jgi:chromosome segregation ATPase
MMLGRLKMEIHDVSAEELAAHLEMHTINHYLQMKRESIHESWLRIRQEFLGRVRQSISECNRTYNDNQKRVATTEQQEQRRIECRIQLNEWRKERYQQAMHEYEERMQQRAQLQALMEQQQSHWARARQRAKQRIDEYHKQLAEEQRKLDEMRQEKEKELALQQALDSRRNKERVEYRKEQLACKQKLAEAKQAEEQRRQESIREMLDRLRQQVAVQAERYV